MKQLIKIHPLTYVFLFISFLSGYFEYMFLLIFIIIIHELGHLLGIVLFNYKKFYITIYPLGGLTTYEAIINEDIYKEIIICILGPLMQCIFMFIVYLLKDYILINTYNKFMNLNYLLFSFNLLPIYPLDGGRFFKLIYEYIFPYRISIYLNIVISFIISLIMIVIFIYKKDLFLVCLFTVNLKSLYKYYINRNNIYNKFLLERYMYEFEYRNCGIIDNILLIKKSKKYRIKKDNFIFSEKEYLKKYVFNL